MTETDQTRDIDPFDVVSVLLDWKTALPFTALSQQQSGAELLQYRISVNPRRGTWKSVETVSGFVAECVDEREGWTQGGVPIPAGNWPATSVRLAFPLILPIWGRQNDQYIPTFAKQIGQRAYLHLRNRHDPALVGTVSVDLSLGLAIGLHTPDRAWRLVDITEPPGSNQ